MSTKNKAVLTVLVFGIVGFVLNPATPLGAAVFGPMAADGPAPAGGQLALLMLVNLVQAIAFGLGAAFLLFAFPAVRRLALAPRLARAAHLAIAWFLVSWVPHSAMHATAGGDLDKLIVVEYVFHITLIAAGAAVAWALVKAGLGQAQRTAAPSSPAAPTTFALAQPRVSALPAQARRP